MHELTELWWTLFINWTDGTLRAGTNGWIYTPRALTREEVSAALHGHQSLGVYAVSEKGYCRWVCLDADTDAGREQLIEVAAGLNPHSTLFELSRRGAHLWWFCPPTAWHKVQAIGTWLLQGNPERIEIFPKGRGRNGVRLPLTPHPRTGDRYPVVDPVTGEVRSMAQLRQLRPEALPQLAIPADVAVRKFNFETDQRAFSDLFNEVQRFTELRQYAPDRAIGRCPFHDDHRPSLSLLGGFWRCWAGCGEGGIGVFRAVARQRGLEVIHHDFQTTQ